LWNQNQNSSRNISDHATIYRNTIHRNIQLTVRYTVCRFHVHGICFVQIPLKSTFSFSFTSYSKFFSWIIIKSSGHLHVCHWVGKTLSLVKKHVHVLKTNCLLNINFICWIYSLTVLLFSSLFLSKQLVYRDTYRIVNEIPWYVSYREVMYRCNSIRNMHL
jgi:hypothetical protein